MRIHALAAALAILFARSAYSAKDSCFDCHSVMEGTSVPFKDDIHYRNGISCADCHGGDPNEDDQNISMSAQRGFKVRVAREGMADFCGRCHSDAAVMHRYKPRGRVDQVSLYRAGVHSRPSPGRGALAATCVDCHGIHNIRAVDDAASPVNPERLAGTCGKCHGEIEGLLRKSPHGPIFVTKAMAGCAACHSSHATAPASAAMLTGRDAVCARCHPPGSAGGKAAVEMARLLTPMETAARTEPAGPKTQTVNANLAKARVALHAFQTPAAPK